MKKLLKLLSKLVLAGVGLFVGTFAIYFGNYDMKLFESAVKYFK